MSWISAPEVAKAASVPGSVMAAFLRPDRLIVTRTNDPMADHQSLLDPSDQVSDIQKRAVRTIIIELSPYTDIRSKVAETNSTLFVERQDCLKLLLKL